MRFVIINHAYDEFLNWLYESKPNLARQTFATQLSAYYDTLFASSDFYANALSLLGHDVLEVVVNNRHSQQAWLKEHSALSRSNWLSGIVKWLHLSKQSSDRNYSEFDALLAQVRAARPDVVFNQSVYAFDDDQLRALKASAGLLVGEHAAMPLPETIDYKLYDMIVSSFPPTIDWLRARGIRAELNRLAFDPRVAAFIPARARDTRVSFAGSFLPVHRSRLELIEVVAAEISDISVHGAVAVDLAPLSPLAGKIKPALWGRDMYALLRRSMVTLNHHGDVPAFANNMRLYEATGMGCLLVTDYKENLHEMFEPDREVVAYRDAAECVDKILFYLEDRNSVAREKIASAGQKRTLREHTYLARMKGLIEMVRTI